MKILQLLVCSLGIVCFSCGDNTKSSKSKTQSTLVHEYRWQSNPAVGSSDTELVITFPQHNVSSVSFLGCQMKCCGSSAAGIPYIEEESNGEFHLHGLRFHKQGTWRVHLSVQIVGEPKEETYTFEIKV